MGPPSDPISSSASQDSFTQQKILTQDEDIMEKCQNLKRRYEELGEGTSTEPENASENVQDERMQLLQRILELEAQAPANGNLATSLGNSVSQLAHALGPSLGNDKAHMTASTASSSQSLSSQRDGDHTISPSTNKRPRLDEDAEQPSVSEEIRVPASDAKNSATSNDSSISLNVIAAAASMDPGLESSHPSASSNINHSSFSISQPQRKGPHLPSAKVSYTYCHVPADSDGVRMEVDKVNGPLDAPSANETGRRVSKRRSAANKVENDRVVTPRRSTRRNATVNADSPVRTITENHAEIPAKTAEAGSPRASATSSADASSSKTNQSQGQDTNSVSTTSSAISSSSTSISSPSTGPGSLSSNPYSIFLTSPPPGVPAFNPYANPYLYMASLAAFPGMHPGMHAMHNMMPGMYGGASTSAQPTPNQSQTQQKAADNQQRPGKPKRLKAHIVTTKNISIPTVPRDRNRNPMLPLNVGIMTVISLGEVCMREHFHSERYIFPVGYEVTRRYLSTVNPNSDVVYHCTILDGGDGPKFQIVPSDVPDKPVIASTATGAWSSIVKQANAIRNRQHSNSVSGPDFFGLGQNTIKHLIQELPNANKLRDYVWQNFVEGGPLGGRHAAVIPALPEEYDHSMPIGAYYPSAHDRQKRDASATPEQPRTSHYPPHIMAQQSSPPLASQHQQQPSPPGPHPGPTQMHHPSAQGPLTNHPIPISQPMPLPQGAAQHVSQMVLPHQSVGTPNGLHMPNYSPPNAQGNPGAVGEPNASGCGSGQPSPFSANAVSPSAGAVPPTPTTIASIMHAFPGDGIANGTPPS